MDIKNSLITALDHNELFSENGICETLIEFDTDTLSKKPFIIISGDNASGKSFLCNALKTFLSNIA